MENNTSQPGSSNEPPFYKRRAFIYLAIACAALITTGIAAIFHKNYPGVNLKNLAAELINNDVPPGGNKAVLTLSSGKMIILNETADGKIGEEGGLVFFKTGDGQLRYEMNTNVRDRQYGGFHVISTPKGGTYEVTLPDGSNVWLNAASEFKFPVYFTSMKERKIELSGEAFFNVIRDVEHPFKVVTDRQVVQVIGTDFNVNNYDDEPTVKTTLFEGAIRVRSLGNISSPTEVALKIGDQAIIGQRSINIRKVDTAEVGAWKNRLFLFRNQPLERIMKKLARWYDVEVVYQNIDHRKIFLSGKISRYKHLSDVLKLLEVNGQVHFKIEVGKIIVIK
ncbi:FecR family protein [Pedobacter nyackensis]|uniref:FecR family protein n=1 Tax=Pedobacter nyackensis TaxID=475255 RepID=A0A1W2EUV2_9SPHI|nr:FecR family protein [Pedobacter nyackensis]SMD13425.1 FecR family protein [Pedobacter nyackensis]